MEKLDILIIGAGVVGAALAYALRHVTADVIVVESRNGPGQGMTSRNSGVVHAGIYYPPDSLKTRLCRRGNLLLRHFAAVHDVPFCATGKYLVANHPQEDRYLHELLQQQHEVPLIEVDAPTGIRSERTLFSPNSAVIDPHELVERLLHLSGWPVVYGQKVEALQEKEHGVAVALTGETVLAKRVYNCCGLAASAFSKKSQHHFARGHYFKLNPPKNMALPALVYPAVPKKSSSLGIHLTRNLYGEHYLGPDLEWVTTEHYGVDPDRKPIFLEAARAYLPWLEEDMLEPGYAGIRAKLRRGHFSDFLFEQQGPITHCLGIESPGLTSALAIGEYLTKRDHPEQEPFADVQKEEA